MAILIEGISVVTKVADIHTKIPGGWEGFKQLVPNKTLCCDNEIARVGFMTPDDVKHFVDKLESLSLVYMTGNEAKDIAVVDQVRGITTQCSWLEFGHISLDNISDQRVAACRLVGSTENQLFTPEGWKFKDSLSSSYGFSPTEHSSRGMKFLRHENGLDVYLNELTGKEVYVGRTGQS